MSSISKKKDLSDFINGEINKGEQININKAFKLFNKCLTKSLIECLIKFYEIDNIELSSALSSCLDLVYHVYWSLLAYTNNIKLTIFLSERAVLLYSEFITMSQNPILNSELTLIPNINDALTFAYKKTIGPLKIFKNIIIDNTELNKVREASLDIKFILKYFIDSILLDDEILKNIKEDNELFNQNISSLLDNIILYINKNILKLYIQYDNNIVKPFIHNKLNDIFIDNDNVYNNITILKIILESIDKLSKDFSITQILVKINKTYDFFSKNHIFDNNDFQLKSTNFNKNSKKKKIYNDFISLAKIY